MYHLWVSFYCLLFPLVTGLVELVPIERPRFNKAPLKTFYPSHWEAAELLLNSLTLQFLSSTEFLEVLI